MVKVTYLNRKKQRITPYSHIIFISSHAMM